MGARANREAAQGSALTLLQARSKARMSNLLEPDRNQIEIFVDPVCRHASTGFISLRAFSEVKDEVFRISTLLSLMPTPRPRLFVIRCVGWEAGIESPHHGRAKSFLAQAILTMRSISTKR